MLNKKRANWALGALIALSIILVPSGVKLARVTPLDYGPSTRTPAPTLEPTESPTPTPSPEPTASPTPAVYELLSKKFEREKLEAVSRLQERLAVLGYFAGEADGYYGNATFAAIVAFQRNNSLEGDGLAGAETQRILFESENVIDASGRRYVPEPTGITHSTPTPTPKPQPLPMDDFSYGARPNSEHYTENGYDDGYVCAELYERELEGAVVTLARVKLTDVSSLRSALAGTLESPATNTLVRIADYNRAVLAIAGDDYASRQGGYAIRQYRELSNVIAGDNDLLIIDSSGDFHIYTPAGKARGAREFEGRAYQAYTSGPALIINRIVQPERARAGAFTAIGQTGELEYLVASVPGELSAMALAECMLDEGCYQAYTLTTRADACGIYFGGALMGAAKAGERYISDILYFAALSAN